MSVSELKVQDYLKDPNPIFKEIDNMMYCTLKRETRSGIANINGITYSENEFNKAVHDYMKRGGCVSLAPSLAPHRITISKQLNELTIGEIQHIKDLNQPYADFQKMFSINLKYVVGTITEITDSTITFRLNNNYDMIDILKANVTSDTTILCRYIGLVKYDGNVENMKITLFDIPIL